MTKLQLVAKLASELSMNKKQASDVLEALTNIVMGALKGGDSVSFGGLGKFVVKQRNARQGINPKTKEKITIAARKVPAFKPAKSLKEAVH